MKKVNILISVITTGFIVGCTSKKPLESAFGINFGEVIDINKSSESIETNSLTMYKINPPKKIALFDRYYIATTPTTHKVHTIYAVKNNTSYSKCLDDVEAIREVLLKKYGNSKDLDKNNYFYGARTFAKDGFIRYTCNLSTLEEDMNKNEIIYMHTEFSNMAEDERVNQLEKQDSL